MSVYKDKNGTWYAEFRYKDWNGENKRHKKRGFKTQKEAKEYERDYLNKSHTDKHLTFCNLAELYLEDCKVRLKASTYEGKVFLFNKNLLPYFGKMHIENIKPQTVRRWQTELMKKGYKDTYLKTIHNQLSAVFNYAVKYCGLHSNPARECGSMGSKHADTMKFWTAQEFDRFDKAVSDKPLSHALLNLLFWSGMREGEALALTLNDIDFENNKISITKTFTVLKGGVEAITPPKTKKSKREIDMPVFCMDIIKEYSKLIYGLKKKDRLFPVTKSYLYHELERGSALAGLQKIRVHDLRHSHASVLINMGVSILLISERLGHENIETTLRTYSHLYPTTIQTTIRQLEKLHDDVASQSQDKQNTYSKTITNQITAM